MVKCKKDIQKRADIHAEVAANDLVGYMDRHWPDHVGGKQSVAKSWLRQAWLLGYRAGQGDAKRKAQEAAR